MEVPAASSNKWESTTFESGSTQEKFRRLMGIKGEVGKHCLVLFVIYLEQKQYSIIITIVTCCMCSVYDEICVKIVLQYFSRSLICVEFMPQTYIRDNDFPHPPTPSKVKRDIFISPTSAAEMGKKLKI